MTWCMWNVSNDLHDDSSNSYPHEFAALDSLQTHLTQIYRAVIYPCIARKFRVSSKTISFTVLLLYPNFFYLKYTQQCTDWCWTIIVSEKSQVNWLAHDLYSDVGMKLIIAYTNLTLIFNWFLLSLKLRFLT